MRCSLPQGAQMGGGAPCSILTAAPLTAAPARPPASPKPNPKGPESGSPTGTFSM